MQRRLATRQVGKVMNEHDRRKAYWRANIRLVGILLSIWFVVSYGWVASDLNTEGTVGEAHLATAEKGEATVSHQISGFIQLMCSVRDTDLGSFMPTKR